jgi:hypothetical protein
MPNLQQHMLLQSLPLSNVAGNAAADDRGEFSASVKGLLISGPKGTSRRSPRSDFVIAQQNKDILICPVQPLNLVSHPVSLRACMHLKPQVFSSKAKL